MTDLTPEDIAASLAGKADHLTVPTVPEPMTITIRNVKRYNDDKRPVALDFGGDLVYLPCLSMRRLLVELWGKDPRVWVGRALTLYVDPDVTYGRDKTGGIRISHASHIGGRRSVSLTVGQNKRKTYTVQPLEPEQPASKADRAADKLRGMGRLVEMIEAFGPVDTWDDDTLGAIRDRLEGA